MSKVKPENRVVLYVEDEQAEMLSEVVKLSRISKATLVRYIIAETLPDCLLAAKSGKIPLQVKFVSVK